MKARLLKTDGTDESVDLPDEPDERYGAMCALVQGPLDLKELPDGFLYYNSEGKVLGLKRNRLATKLVDLAPDDCIVGNVIIMKQ